MPEETHICSGHEIFYMRGTSAGRGAKCTKKAKYLRDGEWFCGIHDPVKIKERRKKREKQADKKQRAKLKTWGFRLDGRIYEVEDVTEKGAWLSLFGKLVGIEHLGELKK